MYTTLSKFLSVILLVSMTLAGCQPASWGAQSSFERVLEPNVAGDDFSRLVGGNNTFALDLYQALRTSDGNLFYSPFSISMALAMTYGGARGDTAAQMADVLHFDLPPEGLHPAFNQLDLDLAASGEGGEEDQEPLQLTVANAIWAQQGHPFLPEYLDLLALNYGAGVNLADFTTRAEPTRKEINRWVSDQTRRRIKDIIAPGVLDEWTRMVLVNAIYFKADWESQFDANDTQKAPFYLLDDSEVQVDMMSDDSLYLPYARGEDYQVVELRYSGQTTAMDIILPDEGQFEAFEAALDWATLDAILSGMQQTAVALKMPKFTFTNQFSLADQLPAMGMVDAFDEDLADFSGMDGVRDLYIGDVIHQAFVAVDEEGTEAAAATVVVMMMASLPMSDVQLTIDRPFFFLIRDLSSGQILFAGRVLNPVD